jgi:carbamoyl-phosphate synthase small subunit
MTYPLIGNYGVNPLYNQADRSYFRGYVVGSLCEYPNNWRAQGSIEDFLRREDIPCLFGVDTRAVTRHIRTAGAMRGVIAPSDTADEEIRRLLDLPEDTLLVREVTVKETKKIKQGGKRVAFLDFGAKKAMIRDLASYGYDITIYPAYTKAAVILSGEPDGVFLSNGPGDPKDLPEIIETVRELADSDRPVFGICLGYQLICLALGADTYKMKFGHRGVNHPVKDLEINKVVITSQNHGYAVKEETLAGTGLAVTHRNVNDGTLEGVAHRTKPLFAVQYHPEASPGPDGHEYLFARFAKMMGGLTHA